MTILVLLALMWCVFGVGFLCGAWWATRPPELRPPDPPRLVVVSAWRPGRTKSVYWRDRDGEWCMSAPDRLAWREEYDSADLRVLDELTDRRKW
jgi:hypothetical protein